MMSWAKIGELHDNVQKLLDHFKRDHLSRLALSEYSRP